MVSIVYFLAKSDRLFHDFLRYNNNFDRVNVESFDYFPHPLCFELFVQNANANNYRLFVFRNPKKYGVRYHMVEKS